VWGEKTNLFLEQWQEGLAESAAAASRHFFRWAEERGGLAAEGGRKGPILPSETLASLVTEDMKEEEVVERVKVSSLLMGFEFRMVGFTKSKLNPCCWI